jgi:predicted Zn-dependent peptidase
MISPNPRSRLLAETCTIPLPHEATLLFRPNPASEIVALVMAVPMGSREEPSSAAGLATLALRMLSRGTRKRTDFELAVALESLGASFSTHVHKDRAFIAVSTLAPRWEEALELVCEMLAEPSFPEEEFEAERELLVKEIREDLDSPYAAASRLFDSTLFAGHPYSHSSQGSEETIANLTLAQVRDYYTSRFGSLEMTLAVVGDLDRSQVEQPLSRLIQVLPQTGPVTPRPESRLDAPSGQREVRELRVTEAESLIYGFLVPGFRDETYPVWKVLDSIAGGSMDSRLFSEIREKRGLVYQIGSSYPAREWQSAFSVGLVTTRQHHAAVLEQLGIEMERLRDTLPDPDELDRAKTYLKGVYLMSQERNSDQAHLLARYHSHKLGIDFIERYPRLLDEVTGEQVRSAARQCLHDPLIAAVGPSPAI